MYIIYIYEDNGNNNIPETRSHKTQFSIVEPKLPDNVVC